MKLLAHRGFWNNEIKPNSFRSFELAFEKGYCIETDFRDYNGSLVVSHDPAMQGNFIPAEDFFKLAQNHPQLSIAINIKADGLQTMLQTMIEKYGIKNYFVFDASVPDLYQYQKRNMNFLTRISDIEPEGHLQSNAIGIWLDAFVTEWYTNKTISDLLNSRKKVAIVSPELHKRDYRHLWNCLLNLQNHPYYNHLYLCTDFPDEAKLFFNL